MKNILTLILAILSVSVAAQEPLSLSDAINRALENNYDMQVTRNKQRTAGITNNWGTAGAYPSFNFTLGSNNNRNFNDLDDYNQYMLNGDLSMRWTIFDGFSVRLNKRRFEELENLSKGNTAILVESTIQSVILSYYAVLLEKEKLDVLNGVMQLSKDRYDRAEQRKELGSAVTYDVLQAQNAYLSDKTTYMLQEVAYKNAQRDLKYLMADRTPKGYKLTDAFEVMPSDYTLGALTGKMTADNKSLKNQYINLNLLQKEVALAKSDYLPTLSLTAGTSATHLRKDNDTQTTMDINSGSYNIYGNLTLSYNLFNGGNRKRALQIAKIEEESGELGLEQLKHTLTNQLANMFEFYLARKELLIVSEENLQAAKLNLTISEEKFKSGVINSFNYRDVQLLYLNAAQRKLEAVYNLIDSEAALLRLTGGIIQEYQ